MKLILLCLAAVPAIAAAGSRIDCHLDHEGETRVLIGRPVDSGYAVAAQPIGETFLFRLIFQERPADIAGVTIATYWSGENGPVMIQQARYPWPLSRQRSHGFTGQQRVFEPAYDGELEYWCELVKERLR